MKFHPTISPPHSSGLRFNKRLAHYRNRALRLNIHHNLARIYPRIAPKDILSKTIKYGHIKAELESFKAKNVLLDFHKWARAAAPLSFPR